MSVGSWNLGGACLDLLNTSLAALRVEETSPGIIGLQEVPRGSPGSSQILENECYCLIEMRRRGVGLAFFLTPKLGLYSERKPLLTASGVACGTLTRSKRSG